MTVTATTPAAPGDAGRLDRADASIFEGATSIPVTLRSLVDVRHGGGFRGVLTGGNGRPTGRGPGALLPIRCSPPGFDDITANVSLTNDAADPVGAYLVSPDGDTLGYGAELPSAATQPVDRGGQLHPGAAAHRLHTRPEPGRWTLVVGLRQPVVGDELSQPFTGNIRFDTEQARRPPPASLPLPT